VLVLAIDSATKVGSVALGNDEAVEGEYTLSVQRTHAERLMPAIERVMADAGHKPRDIDAVVVGTGPGSFTGLRIAISTAKGLSLATGCPVVGVSTLDAMAWGLGGFGGLICPMLDARRGEVYSALYTVEAESVVRRSDYLAVPLADMLSRIQQIDPTQVCFSGDAARLHRDRLRDAFGQRAVFPGDAHSVLRGSWLVEAARQRLCAGDFDDVAALAPLYVRPPEAEVKWADRSRGK
jgi:tRNA threonylcarbamoyladenosine biosynthesis protein TsaB